jgi:hypothetical protein
MRDANGNITPPASTPKPISVDKSKTPEPSPPLKAKPSKAPRPSVPKRGSSYNRTPEASDQHELPTRKKGGEKPSTLDMVSTDPIKQHDELSPKSLPVHSAGRINHDVKAWMEKSDEENVPSSIPSPLPSPGGKEKRSSSVVRNHQRSKSGRDRMPLPTVSTNEKKEKEDDRTPTTRGSFWGRE